MLLYGDLQGQNEKCPGLSWAGRNLAGMAAEFLCCGAGAGLGMSPGDLDLSAMHGEGSWAARLGWDGSALEIWALFEQTGRCQVAQRLSLGEGHRDTQV